MNIRRIATAFTAAAVLAAASTAGASAPFKRYTLAVGATTQIVTPVKLTVLLPTAWKVAPPDPVARDLASKALSWSASVRLEQKGTTLADLRRHEITDFPRPEINGWRDIWGWEAGRYRVVGDTYVTLKIGKAWRETLLVVPGTKSTGWAARRYMRTYLVHRGVAHDALTGVEKELFISFDAACTPAECPAANPQFATIMRSIRFIP